MIQLILELQATGLDILTIGQYLPPSEKHAPLIAYIHPDQFDAYGAYAKSIGVPNVASAPLVRSSYNAAETFNNF